MSMLVCGFRGGEDTVCACCRWLGEFGGLVKVGEVGCWKCSGCSTLTLMAGGKGFVACVTQKVLDTQFL